MKIDKDTFFCGNCNSFHQIDMSNFKCMNCLKRIEITEPVDYFEYEIDYEFVLRIIPKPKWQYKKLEELGIKTNSKISYQVEVYKTDDKKRFRVHRSWQKFPTKKEAMEHVRYLKKQMKHKTLNVDSFF